MIKALKLWLWERRLSHARGVRAQVERDFARERQRAQFDLEHCEAMVSRARMDVIKARADRIKARRTAEAQ